MKCNNKMHAKLWRYTSLHLENEKKILYKHRKNFTRKFLDLLYNIFFIFLSA